MIDEAIFEALEVTAVIQEKYLVKFYESIQTMKNTSPLER